MTRQNVLSSNMAAIPLSFGSPGIGCKPKITSILRKVLNFNNTSLSLCLLSHTFLASFVMQVRNADFRSFSYEEELRRAKWFKEDLEKGGWREIHNSPGVSRYWMKTFPDEPVPVKTLFMHETPVPAHKVAEILDMSNIKYRKEWNRAFLDNEVLETYPEEDGGGWVATSRVKVSWPFKDRNFVAFLPPTKEVNWYGQKAFVQLQKNAWHHSKPAGADGFVRATNGGNFTVIITDEKDPLGACKVFGLRNNNYNGCMPKKGIRFVLKRKLPVTFNQWREGIIEAYEKYFRD